MEKVLVCQSCGMPIEKDELLEQMLMVVKIMTIAYIVLRMESLQIALLL